MLAVPVLRAASCFSSVSSPIRRLSSWALLLGLAGCGEVRIVPGSEEAPAAPPEDPPAAPQNAPACASPRGAWAPVVGLDTPDHRPVAVTQRAFYVASGGTLRRSRDGAMYDVVASFPEPILDVVATDDTVFVVTPQHVLRSRDEGARFDRVDDGLVGAELTLRASSGDVVATTIEGKGFRWSPDAERWQSVAGLDVSMSLAVADGPTVLVDTGGGVIRSVGHGAWTPIPGLDAWGYRDLAISGRLGAAIAAHGEVRVSRDGGASFFSLPDGGQSIGNASRVVVDEGVIYAATDRAVVASRDAGTTWRELLAAPGADGMTRLAARGDRVISSGDVLRTSTDAGARFAADIALSDGVVTDLTTLSDRLLVSSPTGTHALTGDRILGSQLLTGERVQRAAVDGDVAYLALVRASDHFVSLPRLARLDDDVLVEVSLPADSWGQRFDALAARDGRLMVGASVDLVLPPSSHPRSRGIYRSEDQGRTWSPVSRGLPWLLVSDDVVSYPGILDLADDGDLTLVLLAGAPPHRSSDFGDAWVVADDGLSDAVAIRLDRLTPTDVGPIASSRTGGVGLHRFDPAGHRWHRLPAAGLPVGFETIAVASAPGAIYVVASDGGHRDVFASLDGGATFAVLASGVQVSTLRVAGDVLYAGTMGEGLLSLAPASCAKP